MNQQITVIEKDFKNNNLRNIYKYIKNLKIGFKPKTRLCRDKSGRIISDVTLIKKTKKGLL